MGGETPSGVALVGQNIFILVGGNGPASHGPLVSITGRDSHGRTAIKSSPCRVPPLAPRASLIDWPGPVMYTVMLEAEALDVDQAPLGRQRYRSRTTPQGAQRSRHGAERTTTVRYVQACAPWKLRPMSGRR